MLDNMVVLMRKRGFGFEGLAPGPPTYAFYESGSLRGAVVAVVLVVAIVTIFTVVIVAGLAWHIGTRRLKPAEHGSRSEFARGFKTCTGKIHRGP